jgi:polar amino acid transport system substrate-binding protein
LSAGKPSLALAQDGKVALECATNEFRPFGFEEDGELGGVEVDLIGEISKRLDLPINLQLMPWKRMIFAMQNGSIDCMFAAFRTPERETFMDFTNVPFHVTSFAFFTHKDRPVEFKSLESLEGLTIGLVSGIRTSPKFDAAVEAGLFKVEGANSVEANFKKLDRKRIDAVLFNRHVGEEALKTLNLSSIRVDPRPLTATAAYLTFSKARGHADLIPGIDAVLFDILTDGTYERIFRKYAATN